MTWIQASDWSELQCQDQADIDILRPQICHEDSPDSWVLILIDTLKIQRQHMEWE